MHISGKELLVLRVICKIMLFMCMGNCFAAEFNEQHESTRRTTRYERMNGAELRLEIFSELNRFSAQEAAYYDVPDEFCPMCSRRSMPCLMGMGCAWLLNRYFPLEEELTSWIVGIAGTVLGKVLQRCGEPLHLSQERTLSQMRLHVLRQVLREKEKQD